MKEFRLSIPVSLCVTVFADSEKQAKAGLKQLLDGSLLEAGTSLASFLLADEGDFDLRLYANKPFDGIEVEDVCDVEEGDR